MRRLATTLALAASWAAAYGWQASSGRASRRASALRAEREALSPYATLTAVTAIWGSQHSVMKWAVGEGEASSVTAARFCVAAVCLAPQAPVDARTWRAGAELGLWAFCGFAAQAVGLETTTATKSAFLLYLNVKLVPIVSVLTGEPAPPPSTWLWAAVALAGTLALGGADLDAWVVGDAWSVAAALASALFIVRLDKLAPTAASSASLTAATSAATAALALAWTAARGPLDPLDQHQALAALYLGLGPSALCGYLQTVAQREVSATRAAVVYALDPLWAALFAYLFLGEHLGPTARLGAALVATAALAQPLLDVSRSAPGLGDRADLPETPRPLPRPAEAVAPAATSRLGRARRRAGPDSSSSSSSS